MQKNFWVIWKFLNLNGMQPLSLSLDLVFLTFAALIQEFKVDFSAVCLVHSYFFVGTKDLRVMQFCCFVPHMW